MLEYLVNLVERLGHWGYVVIFLGAMAESAAFLGVLVPGESLVLVAGFLAAQHALHLDALMAVVAVGAAVGDSMGYEMGRYLGAPWAMRYGRYVGVRAEHLERAHAFFERHGGKAVFLGRFIGFARALVPFLAGSSRMPYRHFLPYNALGALLWSVTFLLLGYLLGASWQVAEKWVGRASAILAGALVFVFVLMWLWRWLVRHELALRERWARVVAHPRIVALRVRFAPQIVFVQARFSPRGYLGLHLTVGALIVIGASWLFGGIAEDVLTGDPLVVVDQRVAEWLHARATPGLTSVMTVVSALHSGAAIATYAALFALYLAVKRYGYWLLALLLVVPGGAVLHVLVAHAFERTAPRFADEVLTLSVFSFTSGHVLSATDFYGVLAAFLVYRVNAWRWRVFAILAAFFAVVWVAFSRLYLGAHYLSDVLGAWALGVAWLALCLTGVNTLRCLRLAQAQSSGGR